MTIEQAKQTIKSSTLPAEIKAQALGNLEQHWNELPSYLENAIAAAIDQFDWVKTRQGDDYWDSICKRAERGEFDPPAESVEEIEESVEMIADKLRGQISHDLDYWVIHKLATLIHANRLLEKRIELLENKKP